MLDSDVLIAAERGRFDLTQWCAASPEVDFAIAAVTAAELWHSVERATGTHRILRQLFVEQTLGVLKHFDYTRNTARIHARIWATLEALGTKIGDHDLIIAATALEHDASIATFNVKHFSVVAGLRIVVPGKP